jgi:hypothetical protein
MTALDFLLPLPGLLETDYIDVAAEPARVWEIIRHGDLSRSPLVRALFALRALPGRLVGKPAEPSAILLDHLSSSPEKPGFQILVDEPPREVTVGAIGKVWQPDIPFVHVADAAAFEAFAQPGFAKVAWSIRVEPRGDRDARVIVEVRAMTTDPASWPKLARYFRVIGPGSHFIRRSLLAHLGKQLGSPEAKEEQRPLPGDDLLTDAVDQITQGITIAASAEGIWPWLVQMGCQRGGFYAIDLLDNGAEPSAREVHPELQELAVGDVIRATPEDDDGFEVLRLDGPRVLILGGLYDSERGRQIPFRSPRPSRYWHVTWAFVLEPLGPAETRLHVRARAAFPAGKSLHAAWIRPVHRLMERRQLRNLAARAEGRLRRDTARDVISGIGGAAAMAAAFFTPFLRGRRSHWGLAEHEARAVWPADQLVPEPRWEWTHAVEIDAPASRVFPFVTQLGADRGGFYSYQWLENLAGCDLRNAETVHPEWSLRVGDAFKLHPQVPPLRVAELRSGHWLVVHGAADERAREECRPWIEVSWLFAVEALGPTRCRLVSRYRCSSSADFATELAYGSTLVEPIGFVMDRRMLLGIKERAEKPPAPTRRFPASP